MGNNKIEKVDGILLFIFIALTFMGFLMIYSSSSAIANEVYKDSAYFFKKQVLWAFIAFILAVLFFNMPYEKMKKIVPILLIASLILLFMVHIPLFSKRIGGAKRWLSLPFLPSFQPFEFVKLFFILYLADLYSREDMSEAKKILISFTLAGIIFINLILQPDMGGAIIIILLMVFMLIISRDLIKYLLLSLPVIILVVFIFLKSEPYRVKRLLTFLNPWQDPYGAGYQTIQSFIGIGSGGIFGVGLIQSQQKFFFLPTPHTDYIFSIIGEEMGFLGCSVVLFMFFIILWRGLLIAMNLNNNYQKFLAAGLTVMIITQALINIGVAIGLLPSKGTTLPFISFGGSSLVVTIIAASILLSLSGKIYGEK